MIFYLFSASDQCSGCGLCEKACPMRVITMKEKNGKKKPSWGKGCIQCNGCINICPRKAIDYFGAREKELRYFNPEYKKVIAGRKAK